jgi:hypothetical protein
MMGYFVDDYDLVVRAEHLSVAVERFVKQHNGYTLLERVIEQSHGDEAGAARVFRAAIPVVARGRVHGCLAWLDFGLRASPALRSSAYEAIVPWCDAHPELWSILERGPLLQSPEADPALYAQRVYECARVLARAAQRNGTAMG